MYHGKSLFILSQGAMKQLVSSVVTGDNLAMPPPNFRLKVVWEMYFDKLTSGMCLPTHEYGAYQHTSVVLTNTRVWYLPTHEYGTYQHTSVVLTNTRVWYLPTHECGTYQHTSVVLTNTRVWYLPTHECGAYQRTCQERWWTHSLA